MPKRSRKNILFPLGGLDRQGAYRSQAPHTTMDCLNVRPRASIAGRERGGSRPGLVLSHIDDLGAEIRFLEPMILSLGDGFTAYSDTFSGTELGTEWSQASWSSDVPAILPTALASIDTSVSDAAVVRDALPIDTSKVYTVEMFIVPWNGEHHGNYQLYFRMDDSSPDSTDEGVVVELIMTGSSGAYSGTAVSLISGTPTSYDLSSDSTGSAIAGWLTAQITSDTLVVYWNGIELLNQVLPTSHTGKRIGFGLECTEAGGLCLANTFRAQYYSTNSVDSLRTKLIASSGGDIYQENLYGRMTQVSSDLSVRSDKLLSVDQAGQKLYIADYGELRVTGTDGDVTGTDLDDVGDDHDWTTFGISAYDDVVVISNGTGTVENGTYKILSIASGSITLASSAGTGNCSYRIERAPKIYDPSDDTLNQWTATDGEVPTGCPIVANYLDRMVLAGAELAPHVWYMARKGDPLDWDYSQSDSLRAVAGPASDPGVPGEAITALVPHSNDYLIISCRNSLWRLRGDPAYGGSLDALSRTIGIIGKNAWCLGPKAELIFLSLDGLYVLPPGADSDPQPLSRVTLPREFLNINPDILTSQLEYDIQNHGVHIFLTSESSNSRYHWWLDWDRKTFWPSSYDSDHEPTATCQLQGATIEDSGVILGGRDGYLRRHSELSETDVGTSFVSRVLIGPVALAGDMAEGSILIMSASMALTSGDVTWSLRPSGTFEGTLAATESDTGTWAAGLSTTSYPSCRGQAYSMLLIGESGREWAVESITTVIKQAGRRRRT